MGPLQRTPGTASTAFSQDPPWLRRRERISLVKNRMREICTSGSVRDGDGNAPIYSAFELSQCGEVSFEGCWLGQRTASASTIHHSVDRSAVGSCPQLRRCGSIAAS